MWYDVEQNTEEWEALRIGKATASSFAKFMANYGKAFGEPAERYALQIALERINGTKAEHSFSNKHTDRGHEQEPVARILYENEYFVDVTNGGFFDCGLYGDSPDGLVGNDGVIEIKSVIAETHYKTFRRKSFDPAYMWQYIGHLDCTGRDWVDVVSYCSDFPEDLRLIVYRLHKDTYVNELSKLRSRRSDFLDMVEEITESLSNQSFTDIYQDKS